ncbi:MAG: ABC transporter permease, partial [Gammaproteobacteria bacterium]|nr:ABC transporter permease [Gammaproteobacteria bacterium]
MNIKALLKALKLRKFATALLLLQLSLTLGLMVNTVLMTVDAKQKLASPVGFNVDNLIAVSLLPTSGQFRDTDYYISIAKQDMQRLNELEGVVSVSNYNQLPIQRGGMNGNLQDVNFPADQILARDLNYVPFFLSGANGVSNLGVEIVEGRALTADDDITQAYYSKNKDGKDIEWNVVITQSLAKAVYPDSSALGQLTNMGRIVGIAKDFAINPSKTGRGRHFGLFA